MQASVPPALTARAIASWWPLVITLLFSLVVVSILAVFWPTTLSMIQVWQQSSTYSHGYAVIPVAIWMAWRESAPHVSVPVKPFLPGLVVVAAIGFVWLMGELANAAVVSQFAVIGIAVAAAWTVLGSRWARELAFPLGFLFFAVPFGEGLLPVLTDWTANVTIAALRLTGIPVYREGNMFVVPSGSWSVVEACAGVRFLIAAAMTGCIFAWLQYRSPIKRVVFVLLALAAALFANWLRAYALVLMGHLSDNRIGTGADHQWWGWLIFGAVMFALFVVGLRWTDKEDPSLPPLARTRTQPASAAAIFTALMASLLLAAAWPVTAGLIESRADARPVQIEAIATRGGWQAVPAAADAWMPELVAPAAIDVQAFSRDESAVNIFIGMYRNQKQGAELVTTMNQVVNSDRQRWRLLERGTFEIRLNDRPTRVKTAVVRGASGDFLIWHWYWLDGRATSSDVRAKVQLALLRLSGRPDTGGWIAIYTPLHDDAGQAARRLNAFVEAMAGPIDVALEATARR